MDNLIEDKRLIQHEIHSEMKNSYIDYAMSVIVGRALPDVRDGMKPVHRRILYGMSELGVTPDKPFKKSARIVGEVMGKYHPHGDSSIYDAMVRMAQDFSTRYLLVDGHGNFGSVDGDGAAAMRYTEARMSPFSLEMLRDIDKETVDFMPNFDEEEKEPVVLPSRFPNLLVNGSNGIAVGMATSIPPHNLGEVIDGAVKMIDDEDTTVEDLMKIIKGPDFPTGAVIMGRSGAQEAYRTGQGNFQRKIPDHRYRDTFPGQQGKTHRENRRACQGQEDRRHFKYKRRVQQDRHEDRHRTEERRQSSDHAEQTVQAHTDAGQFQHDHDRSCGRSAKGAEPLRDP